MKINIQIDRLVLDGLPVERHQRLLLKAALESELSRLLGANGLAESLMSGGAIDSLPVQTFQMGRGSSPVKLGQQIGHALNGGIGRRVTTVNQPSMKSAGEQ